MSFFFLYWGISWKERKNQKFNRKKNRDFCKQKKNEINRKLRVLRPTLSPVTLVQFVFFRYGFFFLKGFPVRAFFSQRIYSVNPWRFTFESFFGKINVLGEIYSAPGGHLFGQGGFKNSKKKLFSGQLNLQCIVSSAYPKSAFLAPPKNIFQCWIYWGKLKKQISLLNSLKKLPLPPIPSKNAQKLLGIDSTDSLFTIVFPPKKIFYCLEK